MSAIGDFRPQLSKQGNRQDWSGPASCDFCTSGGRWPNADIKTELRYGAWVVKFGELKSIGHNIADSLESGIGLLNGVYGTDIFGEAAGSPEGHITVDFLTGTSEGGNPSETLKKAIYECRGALAKLCERHGVEVLAFKTLTARYGVDRVYGGHFTVTVEDQKGRRSVDQYLGMGGRRLRTRR